MKTPPRRVPPIVPRGTVSDRPVYQFEVGQSIIEALAAGICPEPLAVEAHRLLRWKRMAVRATTPVKKRG